MFWKKLIQRELTCEKPVAYAEESTYLKDQIPVGMLMVTINKSHAASQSMTVLTGIWDEYFAAAYCVDTMKELGVCPKLLQTDCGTENVLMAAIQSRLQASVHAHRYSSSVANIRIENWWSHNRKGYTGWLINFFKDMVATGEFNLGNTLHMERAWYTFSPLLQYELDQVKLQWDTHYIRRTRHDTIPWRPRELFFLAELSGGQKPRNKY